MHVCLLVAATVVGQAGFQLMDETSLAMARSQLPKVEDTKLAAKLASPHLMPYTEAEIPRAHQDWEGGLQGIHSAYKNVAGDGVNVLDKFGNANREFPWGGPAGTESIPEAKAFRFVMLPRDENGNVLPMVVERQAPYEGPTNVQQQSGYAWTYPIGTTFGEVLMLDGPDKKPRPYELRLRRRAADKWLVDVQRPYVTAIQLAKAVKAVRTNWRKESKTAALVNHLEGTPQLVPWELSDNQPDQRVFTGRAKRDFLPEIDAELVSQLLDRPFRSALGQQWREGHEGPNAATTNAPFHVVPPNYSADLIPVDSQSCARCHSSTNKSASEFDYRRDWYGRVRGSDGILSFHPFDPSCVSHSGYHIEPVLHRGMTQAGLVENYDQRRHSGKHYRKILGLK